MIDVIQIDGSLGEGGGQILRTALALSICTGKPFQIEKIRAGREKPGLLRQHLTAVHAATAICGATVDGAAIGSQALSFTPGKVCPGEYTFAVGSAGSATLVLQTILPALLCAPGPSALTLEGGTHNPHAPPFDFLERAFIPLINRMGPTVHATLERAGFYPAGGGRLFVSIEPVTKLQPLNLMERGEIQSRQARAVVSALPGEIAKRELAIVEKQLGWQGEQLQIRQLPPEWGPGNALMLEISSENVTEVFTGFGAKGVTAEAVAVEVVRQARRYLGAQVPVASYLADQLLLPLALAGSGSFRTLSPTRHTSTNVEVIQRFVNVELSSEKEASDRYAIRATVASQ